MRNKKNYSGMLVLLIGTIVIGNLSAQTDNRLNGSWVQITEGVEFELRLRNGNFEELYNDISFRRGTFTTTIREITIVPTHIHVDGFKFIIGDTENELGLESKWYTFYDFIIIMRASLLRLGLSERDVNEFVESALTSDTTSTYSVDGNILTLMSTLQEQKHSIILTRR